MACPACERRRAWIKKYTLIAKERALAIYKAATDRKHTDEPNR